MQYCMKWEICIPCLPGKWHNVHFMKQTSIVLVTMKGFPFLYSIIRENPTFTYGSLNIPRLLSRHPVQELIIVLQADLLLFVQFGLFFQILQGPEAL